MRFFTSDMHFGHKRIIELAERPFSSLEEMNEMIVANWNSVVGPDDDVYVLGDVALGPIMESLAYVERLMGRKHLVIGNHDRCFAGGKRSKGLTPEEWVDVYVEAGFAHIYSMLWTVIGGEPTYMSHFPYVGDSEGPDRFGGYRLTDRGLTLLHGHTHSKTQISHSPAGTLQINVGVDANFFTPVFEDEIVAIIENDPIPWEVSKAKRR